MKVTSVFLVMVMFVFLAAVPPVEGQIADTPLSTPIILPQWADGLGWSSEIVITNYDTIAATQVQLDFYQSSGSSFAVSAVTVPQDRLKANGSPTIVDLPAGGRTTVKTLGSWAQQLMSGWVRVKAGAKIGVQLKYHYPYGAEEQVTTVLPGALRRGHTISVDYLKSGNYIPQATGVAFANPNENATYVDLTLLDISGLVMNATPKRINLPPNGHIARYFHEAELFADFLASRSEFHGTLQVVAGSPIGAMSAGFTTRPDGKYLMDNSPALPPTYKGLADLRNNTLLAVCFYANDQTPDPDCQKGMQFVAQEVMAWYDAEFARSGQEDLSSSMDFLRGPGGKVWVELFIGEQTLEYYQKVDARMGYPALITEARQRYGSQHMFLMQQMTPDGGGADRLAFFWGPSNGRSWKIAAESYLRTPPNPPITAPEQFRDMFDVTKIVHTAAHELGHTLALDETPNRHSTLLEDTYPGKFANLMSNGKQMGDGWDSDKWGIGVFRSTNMPDIKTYGNVVVNTALDRFEIQTLLKSLAR